MGNQVHATRRALPGAVRVLRRLLHSMCGRFRVAARLLASVWALCKSCKLWTQGVGAVALPRPAQLPLCAHPQRDLAAEVAKKHSDRWLGLGWVVEGGRHGEGLWACVDIYSGFKASITAINERTDANRLGG